MIVAWTLIALMMLAALFAMAMPWNFVPRGLDVTERGVRAKGAARAVMLLAIGLSAAGVLP